MRGIVAATFASNISPVLVKGVQPLEYRACQAALVKGTDEDRPRNLAKSVTVK
jgi:glucosamine 6-phosphate synthetase-like amidotransferase/phosphosugar isomerase protein